MTPDPISRAELVAILEKEAQHLLGVRLFHIADVLGNIATALAAPPQPAAEPSAEYRRGAEAMRALMKRRVIEVRDNAHTAGERVTADYLADVIDALPTPTPEADDAARG